MLRPTIHAMPNAASPPATDPEPSAEDAPILDLERFAALSADIEAGTARDEVIAREGLTVAAWTRAQESWLGKMAEEAGRKRFELTNRYNTAFVAQRRSHDGAARRASKSKGARVEAAKVAPVPPPIASAPAFVAAVPPPIAAAPAYVAPPSIAAAPAVVTPAPAYVARPPRPAPTTSMPATEASPVAAAPALPFAVASAGAPPVIVASAPPPPLRENLGETTAAPMTSPFASKPLPFTKSSMSLDTGERQRPSSLPAATPFDRPSAPPAPPAPTPKFDPNAVMDLSGTVSAELLSPVGVALPFRDSAGRPPPPAPPPPPGKALQDLPFRASAPAAAPPVVASAPPSAVHAPPPAAHAPPVAAPVAPRAVRFTLEQFTSLTAEIAVAPATVAQVRGRYGLDEASHRAEAEEWGRRFAADKELFARYSALFQIYRDWLSRSPR